MPLTSATFVVVAMLVAQTIVSMGTLTLPAIAPALARAFEVDASAIGYQISIVYAGAMASAALGGSVVQRIGAGRTTQTALAAIAAGMALGTSANIAALMIASLLLGLGYGLSNPAAAELLVRYTPASRRNLIFSLKQTGVPLGGMAAAMVAPGIASTFGWRAALLLVTALAIAMVVLLQFPRSRWDAPGDEPVPLSWAQVFGGISLIWREPSLRYLSLMALCFAAVQLCLMTFTVTLLVAESGYSLVRAGLVLSVVQFAGAIGRIAWGWAADRTRSSTAVLIALGAIMLAATLAVTRIDAGWSAASILFVFVAMGSTAIGWNGVFLAEVARLASTSHASTATGGALFFTFAGVLLGPSAFAAVYGRLQSYTGTFVVAAILAATGIGLAALSRAYRTPPRN
ncbi:MAG: MFS transporter [Burkholderiaceae bacterium]|nr:MFS transporter [Burkholderiaceae bacterium]